MCSPWQAACYARTQPTQPADYYNYHYYRVFPLGRSISCVGTVAPADNTFPQTHSSPHKSAHPELNFLSKDLVWLHSTRSRTEEGTKALHPYYMPGLSAGHLKGEEATQWATQWACLWASAAPLPLPPPPSAITLACGGTPHPSHALAQPGGAAELRSLPQPPPWRTRGSAL